MEILRFEESDAPAPKKKRPSKGLLALGLVAALMGIGTAFASSTITLNKDNITPLGAGVTAVTTCDQEIGMVPQTDLVFDSEETPDSFFTLSSLDIGASTEAW